MDRRGKVGDLKVLLAVPPVFPGLRWAQQMPPIGISSIGAVLQREGHKVLLHDGSVDGDFTQLVETVRRFKPEIVGISFTTMQFKNAVTLADKVKKEDAKTTVVAGGIHATPLAEPFLKHCPSFDIVVRGEGESTMLELVSAFERGIGFSDIRGLTYRDGNGVKSTDPRPFIEDLNTLPFASSMFHFYSLVAYSPFEDLPMEYQKGKVKLPMMTTRGCPFGCTFCYSNYMWGRTYRMRNPKKVVDEIEKMIEVYGMNYLRLYDDNFCVSEGHVFGICDEIVSRGLEIEWRCEARVGPTPITDEMLQHMREAGCHMIEFGVESGSPRMLKRINKQITVDQIREAFQRARKAGLRTKAFMITCLPGENVVDTIRTAKLLREIKPDTITLGTCQILPETPMYHNLLEKGVIDEELWFDYNRPNIPRYYEFCGPFERYAMLIRRELFARFCKMEGFF